MKEHTTRFFKAVAFLYMGTPVVHIILAALVFDISISECITILLSPSYYLVSGIAALAGYGLWEMRHWSWYLFVIANFMLTYENALFVNSYGSSLHPIGVFLLSVIGVGLVVYRIGKEIRVPYFFPKIRWWETDPRYKLVVPTQIRCLEVSHSMVVEGQIMDLSMTGCFVKLRNDLNRNEDVSLEFSIFGHKIHCRGTVVWLTQSTVTHPKGVGIKFNEIEKADRRHLRYTCRKLKRIASLYRKTRYLLNHDEFARRLQEIETSRAKRRGFIRKPKDPV